MNDSRLGQLRLKIDRLDRGLLELLKERAALALEIGGLKKAAGHQVFDAAREAAILERLAPLAPPLPPAAVQDIFKAVIRACRSLQEEDLCNISSPPGRKAGRGKEQETEKPTARKENRMSISKKMTAAVAGSSMIRKMFEEGIKMKAQYGAENVYDFSLGNPDVPPPPALKETLIRLIQEDRPGLYGYMPNAGFPHVREKVAAFLTREQGPLLRNPFSADNVIMTVGAAGALNITLKAIVDPGDEIITPKPYFMEYNSYADNFGGKLVPAESGPGFRLDIQAINDKITPQTRAVLINSPHNPTGVIYQAEELAALGQLLTEASKKNGRIIYLLSDEPYRKLAYGGALVPSVFPAYPYSVIGTSHSKDMSLPGERIGYAAVNPDMPDSGPLFNAMVIANRIMGFVSAPSLAQLAVGELQGVSVDIGLYEERRDQMVEGLQKIGYELTVPGGAFYLFPKTPIADDAAFVEMLKAEKILTVPGRGFSAPGYFRICYCTTTKAISNSMAGFARAFAKARA